MSVGLVAACDDLDLFGFQLFPRQREILAAVESGPRLHVWALGRRSGKTTIAALVGLWDALLRPDLHRLVRPGERRHAVAVACSFLVGLETFKSVEAPAQLGDVPPILDSKLAYATRPLSDVADCPEFLARDRRTDVCPEVVEDLGLTAFAPSCAWAWAEGFTSRRLEVCDDGIHLVARDWHPSTHARGEVVHGAGRLGHAIGGSISHKRGVYEPLLVGLPRGRARPRPVFESALRQYEDERHRRIIERTGSETFPSRNPPAGEPRTCSDGRTACPPAGRGKGSRAYGIADPRSL